MSQSSSHPDRVFLRPQYALIYQRMRRLRWTNDARAEYAAMFLLDGRATCQLTESTVEIQTGGAVLLEPGETAKLTGREGEYLSLSIAPSYVLDCATRTRLISAGSSVRFSRNMVGQDKRLHGLARDLADELREEEPGQEMVVAALVEQLLVQLLRHHSTARRSEELELSRVGLVDRRIRRAVELMHAHLERELPLEEIAAAAYLSPFHFARLFKKLTGASPHAYLATLRVERAQTLLAETDLSIAEVSARVGYSSPSHFAKAFRQSKGLTPRAFRSAVIRG